MSGCTVTLCAIGLRHFHPLANGLHVDQLRPNLLQFDFAAPMRQNRLHSLDQVRSKRRVVRSRRLGYSTALLSNEARFAAMLSFRPRSDPFRRSSHNTGAGKCVRRSRALRRRQPHRSRLPSSESTRSTIPGPYSSGNAARTSHHGASISGAGPSTPALPLTTKPKASAMAQPQCAIPT